MSPDSELLVRDVSVRPRDDAARAGLADHLRFGPPTPGFAEQVFFHEPHVGPDGLAAAAIVNRALGFGAFVRWRAAELPVLAHWKMTGEGEYVCGLEPSTHAMTKTRREQRENGSLRDLAPGESVSFRLEIGALPDAAAVLAFENELQLARRQALGRARAAALSFRGASARRVRSEAAARQLPASGGFRRRWR